MATPEIDTPLLIRYRAHDIAAQDLPSRSSVVRSALGGSLQQRVERLMTMLSLKPGLRLLVASRAGSRLAVVATLGGQALERSQHKVSFLSFFLGFGLRARARPKPAAAAAASAALASRRRGTAARGLPESWRASPAALHLAHEVIVVNELVSSH